MLKQIILILLLLTSTFSLQAQGEIEATVRISSPQLQQADRRVFDQMEVALREFLNNTKWTQDRFETDERIKCNFIFTISEELGNNSYRTELAIQAVRPIYGSDFRSPLISHLDKDCVFSYQQDQPIEFLLD
ncbi:MAG: DUF4835 family protein, partial [Saprospiraceae bacterium]|nr:DUF4835 family protein [Saprospiraceae bacterium]